ncbi:hypothetical protein [Serratia entomophila]|uniref:hypothetical protein n=1 Tax=Serratia entomophila TaxID=42906 RepID=UPI0021BB00CF|nr:hypothetical protein [Serratia entomophila]
MHFGNNDAPNGRALIIIICRCVGSNVILLINEEIGKVSGRNGAAGSAKWALFAVCRPSGLRFLLPKPAQKGALHKIRTVAASPCVALAFIIADCPINTTVAHICHEVPTTTMIFAK